MNCDEFREKLSPYLDDALDEEARRAFRRHLNDCAACRREAVGREPALLFLPLGEQRKDEFYWASFWRDLRGRLPERRPRAGRARVLGWAAAAVLVLAAGAASLPFWLRGGAPPAPPPAAPVATAPAASTGAFVVTVDDPGARSIRYEAGKIPIVMVYDRNMKL